jgi:glycerol-3-phosphate acyltransferase PlsY
MLWIILGTVISYLIGSIPTGYIFGRLLKGIDIRRFGSGNIGATNVLRVLGKWPGITVLILDVLKGLLPIIILGDFILSRTTIPAELLYISLGISCIVGHNWTVFLGFKGGKGIATTLGVLFGFALKIPGLNLILCLLILTWLLVFTLTKIVSVASIISAVTLPLYMVSFKQSRIMIYSSIILSVFVILRHQTNLIRLFQGKESRLTFKKSI